MGRTVRRRRKGWKKQKTFDIERRVAHLPVVEWTRDIPKDQRNRARMRGSRAENNHMDMRG